MLRRVIYLLFIYKLNYLHLKSLLLVSVFEHSSWNFSKAWLIILNSNYLFWRHNLNGLSYIRNIDVSLKLLCISKGIIVLQHVQKGKQVYKETTYINIQKTY